MLIISGTINNKNMFLKIHFNNLKKLFTIKQFYF